METEAEELERLRRENDKLRTIVRAVYAEHLPDALFICGHVGKKDDNGLPEYLDICPAYGVGWTVLYKKTDRSIMREGG